MSYLISLRKTDGSDGVGPARYLVMDDTTNIVTPAGSTKAWADAIVAGFPATPIPASNRVQRQGDLLFLVHGFNVNEQAARNFHIKCRDQLKAAQWDGMLISYDWPSDGLTFGYLPDRASARASASTLVSAGIALLEARQQVECAINVHIMAHSMGAFVTQQAFTWAYQDVPPGWKLGQVLFVAGDVDNTVFSQDNPSAKAFAQHAGRLTSYSNGYDKALLASNVKRVGLAPRVGRVGLPDDTPAMMVGVDCSALFKHVAPGLGAAVDPAVTHSFYFDRPEFWQDAVLTLAGGIDRNLFPCRDPADGAIGNRFTLKLVALDQISYSQELQRARQA